MRRGLFLGTTLLALTLGCVSSRGQVVPVKISLVAQDDNIALQYEKALENTIELLPGYSLWRAILLTYPKTVWLSKYGRLKLC